MPGKISTYDLLTSEATPVIMSYMKPVATNHCQGRCPLCLRTLRITRAEAIEARWQVRCPACRAWTIVKPIYGTKTATPCDARCTSARGHECECSCSGENHGADHHLTH